MTSKEAFEILRFMPAYRDGERVQIDPIECHDLVRLGLVFGRPAYTKRDDEKNRPMLAFATKLGCKLRLDEQKFHEWWNETVTKTGDNLYTEECIRQIILQAWEFVLESFRPDETSNYQAIHDIRRMERQTLGQPDSTIHESVSR